MAATLNHDQFDPGKYRTPYPGEFGMARRPLQSDVDNVTSGVWHQYRGGLISQNTMRVRAATYPYVYGKNGAN